MDSHRGKNRSSALAGILLICFFCTAKAFCGDSFSVERGPRENIYLYDKTGILEDVSEYSNQYLRNILQKYSIEIMIVSLPYSGDKTVEELAVEIFSQWGIGKDYAGRGVLLLLVNDNKQVKLEVSYELEDVFTDAFCGYIEDIQLKPYYFSGQLGIGLLSVIEEIEKRAQIKHLNEYSVTYIKELDDNLLSGGAGATRDLTNFDIEKIEQTRVMYPAGKTSMETWQTMIQSWRDKAREPNKGIYTEVTKLIFQDYKNLPDSRFEEDIRIYADKSYTVIQNEDYAVIFFCSKQGWENSPFLLCRKKDGWKFDIVHQRKYIRMGDSPHWGIERGSYPYIDLLGSCPYWMGQDIPLEGDDIYKIENDGLLADKILKIEGEYKKNPNDFYTVMELGRLYTVCSMGQKAISVLKKAKELNPASALTYKYSAIAYVDANYQYKTAVNEMEKYVKINPNDVFGHNFLGYLYYCIDDYKHAVDEFKQAINLREDNCYAYCKLSRAYSQLFLKSGKLDPRRQQYKNLAIKMYEFSMKVDHPEQRRVDWLMHWLDKQGILSID